MNKIDKQNLLRNSIGTYNHCCGLFNYDPNELYFYVLGVADNLFLCVEEDDFMLDGFQIRKISDLKKLEIDDNLCHKINEENRLLEGVNAPAIDLSTWKSVFESLKPLDTFIIVENEKPDGDGFFYMGRVTEIQKTFVVFSAVDADGVWYENIKIPYSEITSVTFNNRYSQTWQKYMQKH